VTILHVEQEVVGDDTRAVDSVLESDEERAKLLDLERKLVGGTKQERWEEFLFIALILLMLYNCVFFRERFDSCCTEFNISSDMFYYFERKKRTFGSIVKILIPSFTTSSHKSCVWLSQRLTVISCDLSVRNNWYRVVLRILKE